MLQVNAGSIWIGQKVMERIREENQSNQRRSFFIKLTLDKVSSTFFQIGFIPFIKIKFCFFFSIAASTMVFNGRNTISNILHSRFDI